MLATFSHFSLSHFSALAAIALFTIFTIFTLRRSPESQLSKALLYVLTFLCFSSFPHQYIAWKQPDLDPILDNLLPFHLCDITAFICGFALLFRKPLLCELAYCWGLAATIQGLITPVLLQDFPHPVFNSFFQLHGAIVSTALILPLGLGWRPQQPLRKPLLRCFLYMNLYVILAFIVNAILGTNFGFVSGKPETPSVLDYLGPWPWYLFFLQFVGLFCFTLVLLPFVKKRASSSASV